MFFLSVYLLLFALALYFPEGGVKVSEKLQLRFFTAEDIFNRNRIEYADITGIIERNELMTDTLLSGLTEENPRYFDTIRANADSLRKSISKIEFPGNDRSALFPVFRAMHDLENSGELIRILHYGDSQIEGDRITSYIRNRLQRRFGGYGVGLVPAEQVYDFSFSIKQENSPNWYRYTAYGEKDTTLSHGRYGALAGFCRFSPNEEDTVYSEEGSYEAWVSFDPSAFSYANTRKFSRVKVFYSHNREPFMNEVYQGEKLVDAEIFPVANSLKVIKWVFSEPQNSLKLRFSGRCSPDIYGIALDAEKGIAVDNIAMRGSSGLIFSGMDRKLLGEMYKELNVKLLLLQFGGNVVPHIVDDYGYYERLFYRQLEVLKKTLPGVSIIVIGLADMSMKEKSRYVTYPNLEDVRDALKNASFKAGTAYWDTYSAMGGKNSMPSWVFANPPLAGKDFVHFNPKGSKIIAQMFYNAFMYEYNTFEKKEIIIADR